MKKITLPKWAVVQSLDGGRMIHIGNGDFVSADAHTPKIIESCTPDDQLDEEPGDISVVDAPEYLVQWALGSFTVKPFEQPATEVPTTAADGANAELEAATAPESNAEV